MLHDGAQALRQARLDWTLGQDPLGPSSMPSLEVGWGGLGAEGAPAPLGGSEGLGIGTRGWGLGLQGRFTKGPWSFGATALALRDQGHTAGRLHRAGIAFQSESGWRVALEQSPFAWGAGLNGGELLGDGARAFPRLSLSTPVANLPFGQGRLEAFAGRLEGARPIPEWIPDRAGRMAAQEAGLDLHRPTLQGVLVQASFGALVETRLGALRMAGGQDHMGQPAPGPAIRTQSLVELRVRIPSLARLLQARGVSAHLSRGGAPESPALSLAPARNLGGFQLIWEGWDLGLEYAAAASGPAPAFAQPAHLAGFSSRGDALGSALGPSVTTRTADLGLPLFLEGRGRLKLVRATAAQDLHGGTRSWFLQAEAQWRTPTGKLGGSLASRREDLPGAPRRWGWSFAFFQAFRVF